MLWIIYIKGLKPMSTAIDLHQLQNVPLSHLFPKLKFTKQTHPQINPGWQLHKHTNTQKSKSYIKREQAARPQIAEGCCSCASAGRCCTDVGRAAAKGRNRQQLRETRGDFTWCRHRHRHRKEPVVVAMVDPLRRLLVLQ